MTRAEKRRRKRAFMRIFSVVLSIAIFVIVLILFVLIFCRVSKVTVKGTDLYSDQQMEQTYLSEKYNKYTITAFLMSKIIHKKNPEFIKKAEIKMTALNHLEIKITEKDRTCVMQGKDSEYIYFDENCVVTEVSKKYIDGSIVVSSSEIKDNAVIGNEIPIPDTDVRTLKALITELKKRDYNITNINLNGESGIVLQYNQIEIRLGTKSNLNDKLKRLTYILPQLENQAGILHLEDWSEDNTDIVFDKAQ